MRMEYESKNDDDVLMQRKQMWQRILRKPIVYEDCPDYAIFDEWDGRTSIDERTTDELYGYRNETQTCFVRGPDWNENWRDSADPSNG